MNNQIQKHFDDLVKCSQGIVKGFEVKLYNYV